MAILFLTGSLEPGKDGVGDYTRLLAFECARQKQECCLIALNDPFVSEPVESTESENGFSIFTLRLPAQLGWEKRVELARAFRAKHPCDWVSLQFVPYSFQPKGMVGNLVHHLESLASDHPLHIMFHELWVGTGKSPSLKDRIIGHLQRHAIQKLVRHLRPRLTTTSNSFYISLLKELGLSATELPLFGNIPISPNTNPRLPDLSQALFFGSIYPEWKPEPFMTLWIEASTKAKKKPHLISAGRRGGPGDTLWKKLRTDYGHAIDFMDLGECPASQVSALMQSVDFGLATTPWHLLGKSGSTAAMLDHGLPVIVTRDEYQPADAFPPYDDFLLHRCDANLESKLIAGLTRRPAQTRLEEITHCFLCKLTEAK